MYSDLKSVNDLLLRRFRDGVCPFSFYLIFASWFVVFAGATQPKPKQNPLQKGFIQLRPPHIKLNHDSANFPTKPKKHTTKSKHCLSILEIANKTQNMI